MAAHPGAGLAGCEGVLGRDHVHGAHQRSGAARQLRTVRGQGLSGHRPGEPIGLGQHRKPPTGTVLGRESSSQAHRVGHVAPPLGSTGVLLRELGERTRLASLDVHGQAGVDRGQVVRAGAGLSAEQLLHRCRVKGPDLHRRPVALRTVVHRGQQGLGRFPSGAFEAA
ncbi:hypothetical protein ACFFX0_30210 [Citricoccus parietis]|uniref:Uncharacterized protein n=1 Tax=Citricoccus parietis TaxID=592307 RepID=A0ABV5G8G0_9MICC